MTDTSDNDKPWIAKLVRGSRFTLGTNPDTSITFEKGIGKPVTEATKLRLEQKAVDTIQIGGGEGDELRQKFVFTRVGDQEADDAPRAAATPRPRARRVHA